MHPDTQKYREKIKTYRGLILFALFVYFALQNLSLIWDIAMRLLSILTPFLIGGGIAFVLNILVSRIEDLLRFTPIRPRLMRIISVISSLLIFALVITPAATANAIVASPFKAMVIATVLCLVSIWGGLVLSAMFPAPPSFIIVTLSTLFWAIAKGVTSLRHR